jgi:hypothetical protein
MFNDVKILHMTGSELNRVDRLLGFIERNPSDAFSRHALAMEYIKMGKDADARYQLETLLADDPGYVGSYYHLGKIHERMGDLSAAAMVYARGMEAARLAGDRHAAGELNAALLNIED